MEKINSQKILYDYALSHVGLPYIWGGDDPIKGYDCSGLCIELLKSVGVFPKYFDTTAHGLKNHNLITPANKPAFGALSFYGTLSRITHVGFCLNKDLMLEAGGGGSKTKSADIAARQNAYIRIRPIKSRSDLGGFGMPKYPWQLSND